MKNPIFSLKNDFYPLLQLLMPLIAVSIVNSGISFFETLFLAHVSTDVLAAGALVGWLFSTLVVILFGTLSAINVLISHQHGAKEDQHIVSVVRDGFALAGLLFIPTFLLLWNMPPIFLILGQTPFVVAQAKSYLHPLAWALLPTLITTVFIQFLLGLGRTRVVMVFTLLSTPLTILLSYLLIFGHWGLPALHIAGAGWGIMLSNTISTIVLMFYILRNNDYKSYWKYSFHFKTPSYILELVRVGLPMGLMYCVEVGFFLTLMLLMGTLGIQALAANQIVFQYFGPLMGIAFSIAQAVTIRMGYELGAKNFNAAKSASYAGTSLTVLFMLLAALGYWFFPKTLIGIDLNIHDANHAEIIRDAIAFFSIAALFQIFEATRITLFGALRALKDTRYTLITSIICFWGIALPVGYFFSHVYHLGGTGLWWGMVLGGMVSVLLLFYRLENKMREIHAQSII
jgi:MATE family multidrug resistance protein